jgi:nucleotide-binding universal stress UspA family protein
MRGPSPSPDDVVGVILIATDGSRAAPTAESVGFEIARGRGDAVVLVCVWAPLRGSFGLPVPEFLEPDFIDAERDRAQKTLRGASDRAAAAGVDAETAIAKGRPADEVCRAARERDAGTLPARSWSSVTRASRRRRRSHDG